MKNPGIAARVFLHMSPPFEDKSAAVVYGNQYVSPPSFLNI